MVETKASAAKDLCVWCLAMNTFAAVTKKVEPKKKQVKELGVKLKSAQDQLQSKLNDLNQGSFLTQ